MNVVDAFKHVIHKYCNSDKPLVIAVSGGRDSMCLLNLCYNAGLNIVVAHCNFTLRGDESNEDELFVTQHCQKLNIPLEAIRFDTTLECKKRNLSVQETARALRYEWFDSLRIKHNATHTLTAHHANDSIETFMYHLSRGSGLKGLKGIHLLNQFILRPLIGILHEDLIAYSIENRITYREDSSNAKDTYTRNYIRHHVIPAFNKINNNGSAHLLNTISLINEADGMITDYSAILKTKHVLATNKGFQINITDLNNYSYKRTLLFNWLNQYGFSPTHIDEIINVQNNSATWNTLTHTAVYDRGLLHISCLTNDAIQSLHFTNEFPAEIVFGNHSFKVETLTQLPAKLNRNCLYLDKDLIEFPVTIRQWKQGDFFMPLGMTQNKKLSDFFVDLKFNPIQKNNCMVIESSGKILAVAPYRINDLYKVTEQTSSVLLITQNPSLN